MLKKEFIRKLFAAGLACALTAGYSGSYVLAETQSQLMNKLNDVVQKQEQNQKVLDSSQKQLSDNNQQQNSVVTQLNDSMKKIETMNGQITAKQAEISRNQTEMKQLKSEINRIVKRIDDRNNILKGRIRSIYINGGAINYLDVLLGSKNFGNFLDRLLVLKMITDQDSKIISAQKADQLAQESNRKLLQNKIEQTTQDLGSLQAMNESLNQEKQNQQGLLAKLKNDAGELNKTVMSKSEEAGILQAQENVIKNQLADLAKEEASKKAVAAASQVKTVNTNSPASPNSQTGSVPSLPVSAPVASADFIMPAAGVISSGFGYRSFDNSFHPGIDIANSSGTPIRAAADGVVFRAYQSSSYGNCVMISHSIGGQLYTTVYAHMTAYFVSDGQKVSQGQEIGTMGQTGEAFGSHLHFELYIGPWTPPPHHGAVNPMNYIR
ncbi:murein hydrolase activator EnvC family protein [Sporolactobacillus putidus]|uniref:Peptidase M24 n=1 Tax=Sporolactobacillus putidus TaxID=492735 RepID=A0A917S3X3_9BACL|nr:peptidoglycan DD-metalloendopeptidase family protein [Sporolactobacillus putidus]GGL55289.1 peptidase M24 [Sporolactobacillus putidus]